MFDHNNKLPVFFFTVISLSKMYRKCKAFITNTFVTIHTPFIILFFDHTTQIIAPLFIQSFQNHARRENRMLRLTDSEPLSTCEMWLEDDTDFYVILFFWLMYEWEGCWVAGMKQNGGKPKLRSECWLLAYWSTCSCSHIYYSIVGWLTCHDTAELILPIRWSYLLC